MIEDTRTPEQHMADIAAATLDRLSELQHELYHLHNQLMILGGYTRDRGDANVPDDLLTSAQHAENLGSEVLRDTVRWVASTLPLRGIDWIKHGADILD